MTPNSSAGGVPLHFLSVHQIFVTDDTWQEKVNGEPRAVADTDIVFKPLCDETNLHIQKHKHSLMITCSNSYEMVKLHEFCDWDCTKT